MFRIMRQGIWIIVSLVVAGCGVLAAPDVPATLQAENEQIVVEATAIAQAADRDREVVQMTAVAAMTEAADIHAANLVFRATLQAGAPSGSGVTVNTDTRPANFTPGQTWYAKTGVSAFINEADGCVISPQIGFTADTPIIYATLLVYNAQSGVELGVSWEYEGTEVHRESLTVSGGAAEQCFWFSIDPSTVELLPGNWIVRLFADGIQLESPMTFAIREADAMMEG